MKGETEPQRDANSHLEQGHLYPHLHFLIRDGRRLPDRYWIDARCYHAWNRGYAGR